MLFIVAVLFILILILFAIFQKLEQNKYDVKLIPGPISYPLILNVYIFGRNVVDYFHNLQELQYKFGSIVRIWPFWLKPIILINDADAIQTILNSTTQIDKSREYNFLKPWLNTGLLISTGAKWHRRRKLLTTAFHFKILENFIEIFDVETDTLVRTLSEKAGGKSFDIHPVVKLCALDIICKTAMGTSINAQKMENTEYVTAVQNFLTLLTNREFSMWKNFDFLYVYSLDIIKMRKCVKTLHNFTDRIIKNRRKLLENQKDCREEENSDYKKKFAFLDLLIRASKNGEDLSNEDIREEVDTFTFEGHDTISSGLSSLLYTIATNPEIQEKIVDELKVVIPGLKFEKVTYGQLQELNYLGQVIKEGLRLYPPVPIYLRDLNESVQLGKYIIPKNSTIAINAFSMHRQEKYFNNPEQFIPERFENKNLTSQHPYCYVPFSAGPRNCIGQKFAMLEMKMIIAKILANFRLLPEPKHKLQLFTDSILKSNSGWYLKIERRE